MEVMDCGCNEGDLILSAPLCEEEENARWHGLKAAVANLVDVVGVRKADA